MAHGRHLRWSVLDETFLIYALQIRKEPAEMVQNICAQAEPHHKMYTVRCVVH